MCSCGPGYRKGDDSITPIADADERFATIASVSIGMPGRMLSQRGSRASGPRESDFGDRKVAEAVVNAVGGVTMKALVRKPQNMVTLEHGGPGAGSEVCVSDHPV